MNKIFFGLVSLAFVGSSAVAQGPDDFSIMPFVVGMEENAAEETIRESGIAVDKGRKDSRETIGKVLQQYPQEQSRVPKDSLVYIMISAGQPMPFVIGKSRQEVEEILVTQSEFNFEARSEPGHTCDLDTAFKQDPNFDERISPDTDTAVVFFGREAIELPNYTDVSVPVSVERFVNELRQLQFQVEHVLSGPGAAPRTEPGFCPFVQSRVSLVPAGARSLCPNSSVKVTEFRFWGVYDCR